MLQLTLPGLRSPIYLSYPRRNSHNQQELWRLELTERTSPTSVEETWPAQASYNEDGAGSDGLLG
jgi:hypothetical protein